jgi:hypothetical protein
MVLAAGDANAGSGLGKAIYDAINTALKDPIPSAQLPDVQKGWQKLSAAIAQGVVSYLVANMEIKGIQTTGTLGQDGKTVTASQSGATTSHVA